MDFIVGTEWMSWSSRLRTAGLAALGSGFEMWATRTADSRGASRVPAVHNTVNAGSCGVDRENRNDLDMMEVTLEFSPDTE